MKTLLALIEIEIPHNTALAICCQSNAMDAFRNYLWDLHAIDPKTVTETDLARMSRALEAELGAIELATQKQRSMIEVGPKLQNTGIPDFYLEANKSHQS